MLQAMLPQKNTSVQNSHLQIHTMTSKEMVRSYYWLKLEWLGGQFGILATCRELDENPCPYEWGKGGYSDIQVCTCVNNGFKYTSKHILFMMQKSPPNKDFVPNLTP